MHTHTSPNLVLKANHHSTSLMFMSKYYYSSYWESYGFTGLAGVP